MKVIIRSIVMAVAAVVLFGAAGNTCAAVEAAPLRRPISTQQPMWLIHIDTWNCADPQAIIDMVPEDIKPYVVFNISLSINHREDKWLQVEYGYETAKSWLRTCAENRVWAMVQPSSGAFSHIKDGDMSIAEEFFRDYPNFLGFNYCEQFWGFGDPWGVTFAQRMDHWAKLMEVNVKYGGYLCWSWCNAYYDADRNFIAMMKLNPELRQICEEHPENFIACEKFTMNHGYHDIESVCMGAWLSGYAGHYGTRNDETGWHGITFREKYPVAAGIAPVLEHSTLTGLTVFDGPETIPIQACHEIEPTTDKEGYTTRQWEFYPQFYNIHMDIFRKILDGTIRLLSRKEVIDRTKLVLIQDINKESDDRDVLRYNYITPESLYDGLYKMPGDGTYLKQYSWFKSTGRYAAIPMVYALKDDLAKSIPVKVNASDYGTRWPDEASKVKEFNTLYPQEYTGDLYVGRNRNNWVVYNPFKTGQSASASVPLKYNSCEKVDFSLPRYSSLLMNEYKDKICFYLNNYDNAVPAPRIDTIAISGVKKGVNYIMKDRIEKRAPQDVNASVKAVYDKGVYTLYITHNGPLDLTVNCNGKLRKGADDYMTVNLVKPSVAPIYYGPHQYEAENMGVKNVQEVITNGVKLEIRNYQAQGYVCLGTDKNAQLHDTITALEAGIYTIALRYSSPNGACSLTLSVNGKEEPINLESTADNNIWNTVLCKCNLAKGNNDIVLSSNVGIKDGVLLDNIVVFPHK